LYKGACNDHFVGCAFDDRGDLLAVATYGRSTFYTHFYYLPKFAKALIPVKLPGPGSNWDWGTITGLAWGGKYTSDSKNAGDVADSLGEVII
jgi:hypothetical protein